MRPDPDIRVLQQVLDDVRLTGNLLNLPLCGVIANSYAVCTLAGDDLQVRGAGGSGGRGGRAKPSLSSEHYGPALSFLCQFVNVQLVLGA